MNICGGFQVPGRCGRSFGSAKAESLACAIDAVLYVLGQSIIFMAR